MEERNNDYETCVAAPRTRILFSSIGAVVSQAGQLYQVGLAGRIVVEISLPQGYDCGERDYLKM